MIRTLLAKSPALAFMAGADAAEAPIGQVVSSLRAQGFTQIEVTTGPTQVKVEASDGGQRVEYVYDRFTGQVLTQEVRPDDEAVGKSRGVEINTSDEDFVDGGDSGSGEGQPEEDANRGHGNDEDGFDEGNPGRGGDRDRDDDDNNDDDDSEGPGRGNDDRPRGNGNGNSGNGNGNGGGDSDEDDDEGDDDGGDEGGDD